MTMPNQLSTAEQAEQHQEDQLDQGLEESFPASDPLSIQTDKTGRTSEPAADKSKSRGQ